MPTHSQKIEAAMVGYLQGIAGNPWPDALKNGSTELRIFAGESEDLKDGQTILCVMDSMQEEFPEKSGNRYSLCRIELRTPVKKKGQVSDPDPINEHIDTAEVLETAVLDDNLAALLTASTADFTAMAVLDRQPVQDPTENYWMTGWTFRLYSCPKAFA